MSADYQLIGVIIAAVAAVASLASATAAWRTANRTSRTAEAASEAIGLVLRPMFTLDVAEQRASVERLPVKFVSISPYTALNVFADVVDFQQKALASGSFPRVAGKPNDVLVENFDDAPTLDVPLTPIEEGDELRLSVVLRFTDERGLQRWEQVIPFVVRWVQRGSAMAMRSSIIELGEPRKAPAVS